jgi:hypothetical protein
MPRLKHAAGVALLALLVGAYAHAATRSVAPSCKTSSLAIWIGLGEGGAALGSTYHPLELSNVSRHTCSLYGFPGVSAERGRQLGSAAGPDRTRPRRTVTLAPAHTAHAILRIVNTANYPAARCRPVTATGLRVFPPNQRAAREIPFAFRACSRRGPVFLSVTAVQPKIGIPGH